MVLRSILCWPVLVHLLSGGVVDLWSCMLLLTTSPAMPLSSSPILALGPYHAFKSTMLHCIWCGMMFDRYLGCLGLPCYLSDLDRWAFLLAGNPVIRK